jgi:hypothetical protein
VTCRKYIFKRSVTHAVVAAKFLDRVALVIIPTMKENPAVKPAVIPNLAGMLCTTYKPKYSRWEEEMRVSWRRFR